MERLISDLLRFSRVGRHLARTQIDPGAVVAEILEDWRARLEARGITVEVAEPLPVVYADPTALRQVLENLLANATKFMGDNPAPRIVVGGEAEGSTLTSMCATTASASRRNTTTRRSRSSSGFTTGRRRSTAPGLDWRSSRRRWRCGADGCGLSRRSVRDARFTSWRRVRKMGTTMDATGKTLLIEDNEDHALLVQSALGDVAPRSVVWLRDGEEALRYLTEGAASGDGVAHPPELILLDMHLPKVSGKEVLRRLRARDALRATPVVMLTTSNDQADVAECYALGPTVTW